jgi:DNA polymerase III delta prime subunit
MNVPFVYKYMPTNLVEFNMTDITKQMLHELIQSDILNVLFVGAHSTGKTILSNIIVNEYYKGVSQSQINDNILIINSLREQGIQYYRSDVKCFCQTKSTIHNKKKIIILDDLDIINNQNQQIFLNYIDKYSHNVHYIATCNNSQKIIDNIHSRLIIIKLLPITDDYLNTLLQKVMVKENIHIEEPAIPIVLSISRQSSRILLNYLEKFKLLNIPIVCSNVYDLCTDINQQSFNAFTNYILEKDKVNAILTITSIQKEGYSVIDILDFYFIYLKCTKIQDEIKYKIIKVLCKYITIFNTIHEDNIELLFLVNDLINQLK